MNKQSISRMLVICLLVISLFNPNTVISAKAASNLVINGVDIGYAPGEYFSTTGKRCTCHGRHSCGVASDCTCKKVSGCCQCYGFALWCENKMFGCNDVSNSGNFYNVGSVSAGSLTASKIKELITAAPIGSHIRTGGSQHSMILMSKTSSGFTVAQANGSNNNEYSGHYNCRVGTATYTWSGYVNSSYGSRGISFIKACKAAPKPVDWTKDTKYPTPFNVYPVATSGKITVYDSSQNAYSQSDHYISYNDLCQVSDVYTNGFCKVTYPTSGGSFTAYAKLSSFIQGSTSPYSYTASATSTSYTRSNMSTTFGSVSKGDNCKVVNTSGSKLQLIYPISSGYKCGWIYSDGDSYIATSDLKSPILGYNASPSDRTPVYQYESTLGGTKYGEIFVDDLCTIHSVNISKNWVNVTYPISGGTKTGYVYLKQFFPYLNSSGSVYTAKVKSNTKVYRKSDMAETIGEVYTTDTIYILGKTGSKVQIEYPVTEGSNAGKYKMGWITDDKIVKNLKSISITTAPTKKTYLEGESLNTSGLVVTAYYDDGSSSNVTGSCSFSGYTSTPGVKTVNVSYSGKNTAFTVTVNSKSPKSITIAAQPAKTSYFVGEEFDPSGLKVTAQYDNNTTLDVTSDAIIMIEDELMTAGSKTIGVQYVYNEKTVNTSFSITVLNKSLQTLSVKTLPSKTVYQKGEYIDTTGLTLTAAYNNGTSETVSSGFDCTPKQLNTAGTQKITVSYEGITTQYSVTVEEPAEEFAITSQPEDVEAAAGERVALHLEATGRDLSYQWQWKTAGTAWKNCTSSGYNTDTFSFTMKDSLDGRMYRCMVSCGSEALFSNIVMINKANEELCILSGPEDVEAAAGEDVVLHVNTSGSSLNYQWQWSRDGKTWKGCTSAGSNTDTFRFVMKESLDGRRYRCIVDDGNRVVISGTALITKVVRLEITSQPEDVEAAAGEKVSVSVEASGDDLRYQWQWSRDGKTWKNCTSSGYNTDTFSFTMKETLDGRQYRCIVSSGEQQVVSENALISIADETLRITEQPENHMVAAGERVNLHVGARGKGLSYQWQWKTTGTAWKNCTAAGHDTASFSFLMKDTYDGRLYRCMIFDEEGNAVISETVAIELVKRASIGVAEGEAGLVSEPEISSDGQDEAMNETTEEPEPVLTEEEPAAETGKQDEAAEETVEQTGAEEDAANPVTEEEETLEETGEEAGAEEEAAAESDIEATESEEDNTAEFEPEAEEEAESEEPVEETVFNVISQPWIVSREEKAVTAALEVEGEGLGYIWQYSTETDPEWREIREGVRQGIFAEAEGEESEELTIRFAEAEENVKVRCVITDHDGKELLTEELILN